jgi:hypothetical protein
MRDKATIKGEMKMSTKQIGWMVVVAIGISGFGCVSENEQNADSESSMDSDFITGGSYAVFKEPPSLSSEKYFHTVGS